MNVALVSFVVVGGCGLWAVLPVFFFRLKLIFICRFFVDVRRPVFLKRKEAILELIDQNYTKSTFCANVDIRVLIILGIKIVVFSTFYKLLWSSFESVWALFLHYKGALFSIFSAPPFDKWAGRWSFLSNFYPRYGCHRHAWGSWKHYQDVSHSCFGAM